MRTKKPFAGLIPFLAAFSLLTSAGKLYSHIYITDDFNLHQNQYVCELVISVLPAYNFSAFHADFPNNNLKDTFPDGMLSNGYNGCCSENLSSANQIVLQVDPGFSFTNHCIINFLHDSNRPD
jgi:hypothetical protein